MVPEFGLENYALLVGGVLGQFMFLAQEGNFFGGFFELVEGHVPFELQVEAAPLLLALLRDEADEGLRVRLGHN